MHDLNLNFKKKNDFNLMGKIRLKVLVVSSLLITALLATQLVFANNLATDGQKQSEVEEEIQKLAAENTSLKIQIAKEASLSNLAKKAIELGFSKPFQIITP